MISFAGSENQILEPQSSIKILKQEMNAFRNLVAYLNPSNPLSDALEERSSAPRDEGEGLSSHEGK